MSSLVKFSYWEIRRSSGGTSNAALAITRHGTKQFASTGQSIRARLTYWSGDVLVSFDVRSETFNLVQAPQDLLVDNVDSSLVNYQGKLGYICQNIEDVDMWVMENAEKQEWSKFTFLSMLQDLPAWSLKFAGVTHPGGEIVIVQRKYVPDLALYVYYYDPKQKSRRRVEIQTSTSLLRVRPSDDVTFWAVTDHVENIMCL